MQQQGAGTAGPDLGEAQGLIVRLETEARPSRAGSLLQWIFGVHKTPVGASLLAMTPSHTTQNLR
ncbi:hypothetical protein DKY63_06230 [Pseudomonas putida]|uniref:Uncharacterized protein n=1 Tax=Pseudomonas putida TaxID=303 RepID=A0A2Z4REU7_PSEPU|nr:hypothetical protein DKY63_06230 [Pseudomonas putida]